MGCFLPHRVMLLYNEDANRQGLPPNRCNPFVNECISGTFLLHRFTASAFLCL